MESKLSRWCDGLIELGWLFAVIAMPLFFNIHSDRVFEPDKLTLLRSIAVVMAAAWLVKFIDLQQWQYRQHLRWRSDSSFWRMPFILIVFLLALVYVISSVFSVTPSVSWAGSYQRLQGTYTTLSYIVIFAVTIATMRTRAQVRRLVTAVIITSIPVAFYGLLQHFGLDPLPWAGNVEARVAGHMGNAIFIAAYLIMAVPLTLARIIASFTNILSDEKLSTADVMRSSIYVFTLAIQLITIYWSGSRGPWLGLGVGLFAFILVVLVGLRNATPDKARFRLKEAGKAILFVLVGTAVAYAVLLLLLRGVTSARLLSSLAGPMSSFVAFVGAVGLIIVVMFILVAAQRGWRWLWFGWLTMSVLLAGWLVAFNFVQPSHTELPVVGNAAETLVEWRELPRIGRFGRMLEAESGTGRVRTLIWEGALELLLPHEPIQFPDGSDDAFNFLRPFIGYGPESMYVAYNPFYPPELATLEARNASPDRSHNETFDALIITGLAGFLVWQALYLSVFYYGFRWLGVLRTRRDRNLLIGLWIGVGILVAVGFMLWRGAVYIGVALPFGSIIGLVLYLVYYALLAESPDEEAEPESGPFAAERLLVVALVAGVLAHYVEIHFGIAIAATRIHFFLYVALLFVVTYLLPRLETGRALLPEPTSGRGRRSRTPAPVAFGSWWGPVLLHAITLGLMIGIMGFTFTTYSQPPDLTLEQPSDLSVSDVFRQSFFVNPKRDFSDSPFIYMMVMLTWSLGTLISLSELVKDEQLQVSAAALADGRKRLLAGIFALLGVVSIGYRLLLPLPATAGATALLGQSLLWLWGALCLLAAARLYFLSAETERLFAAGIALTGLLFTLPVLLAGGVGFGLLLGGICAVLLYLLWDRSLNSTVLPAAVLGSISLLIGLFYTFFQAFQYRASLFYRFTVSQPETMEQLLQFLVEESAQPANFLTYFYLFVFGLMLVTAVIIAMDKKPRLRQAGTGLGYGTLALLMILAALVIYNTNLNVIQADVVFKRGRFYENEAIQTQNVNHWDSAIAIYKDALRRAPREDFYYLFLGRSYLERSALTEDTAEQRALLNEAEQQLLRAQDINPLNTDHTANLARLNTRRLTLTEDDAERQARLAAAEDYYRDALRLSPQNSIVRNEYARLALALKADCDQALAIYQESAAIDPFYAETFFDMAEAYVTCAPRQEETAAQEAYLAEATEAINSATALRPNHVQTWLRAGRLLQQFGRYERALAALEQARTLDPQQEVIAAWNIDFLQAQIYESLGDLSQAEALAQQALAGAPVEAAAQIQLFLAELRQPEPETNTESGENVEFTETVLAGERPLAELDPAARQNYFDAYPDFVIDLDKAYDAIITTEAGVMRFKLLVEESPIAVNNFVFLAQQGFYDGLTFHRVLENFMAQGGDPTGTGAGGPGYAFDIETSSGLNFNQAGMLAMANAGPDTNGSQFFITMTAQPGLNGRYTIFGRLIEGEAVLDAMTRRDPEQNPDFAGDEIIRVDIVEISF